MEKEELQELDEKLEEVCEALSENMMKNLELAKKIGEEHVLGGYKEFIEARVKNLELHIKKLRAKRKYGF